MNRYQNLGELLYLNNSLVAKAYLPIDKLVFDGYTNVNSSHFVRIGSDFANIVFCLRRQAKEAFALVNRQISAAKRNTIFAEKSAGFDGYYEAFLTVYLESVNRRRVLLQQHIVQFDRLLDLIEQEDAKLSDRQRLKWSYKDRKDLLLFRARYAAFFRQNNSDISQKKIF